LPVDFESEWIRKGRFGVISDLLAPPEKCSLFCCALPTCASTFSFCSKCASWWIASMVLCFSSRAAAFCFRFLFERFASDYCSWRF
jgi:hypothetical protein